MDDKKDELSSSHGEEMDSGPQVSHNLDLNIDQASCSPNVACQSSPFVKGEANGDVVLGIGTEFESDEHAYKFYNKYAGLVGFSVRKDWVNRSKVHGKVVSRKFTCSKEGYRRKDKRDANVKRHRKETRTGCMAHMIITRQPNGKYRVTHFEPNHNHDNLDPSHLNVVPSEKSLNAPQALEENSTTDSANRVALTFELTSRRLGDQEGLGPDCGSHLCSERTRRMKEGEAARILHYFQRLHFKNPSFFYAIQLDSEDRISNIFWADDKMVIDYDHFGDVICLDTTYRISEGYNPFIQFIGLNHHRQVVFFGAALLYDETAESFKWLFQTFVAAMSGKRPKTVLTDQDATLVEAINSVLPETNHHLCVWQMYQTALKHLDHVAKGCVSFAQDFRNCIFGHGDEEDFLRAWEIMIEKYSLQQNDWLRWMFKERDNWAVVYGRNTFFVEPKSAHLGESISVYLGKCLGTDLDVLQFFKHFEAVVNEQRHKELQASYEMTNKLPRLMGNVVLLKHAIELYTPRAFEMFQHEYERSLNIVLNLCNENGPLFEYKANIFGQAREHTVTFNSLDDTVICNCLKFEHAGLLCSHAIKVLDHRNIKVVPSKYFLNRWTKDARTKSESKDGGCSAVENSKLAIASRYKDLCRRVVKISSRAAEFGEAYRYASRQLDEVMQGVEKILDSHSINKDQVLASSSTVANASECDNADIFLHGSVVEGQDDNIRVEGGKENESDVSNEGEPKIVNGECSHSKVDHNFESSTLNNIASISCSPPAYVAAQTPLLNHVTQGVYNLEGNQVLQCMYRPNLVVDHHHLNPNIYQQSNFYPSQNDSPVQSHLLQESLFRNTFHETISNGSQMRQGMDFQEAHENPSSFLHYEPSCRTRDTTYFRSK
ncbi:MULE transposase domain [Dillenia turbinata]|uniref:Protein FAR1-RELATED SEQUENCE n=1 Tax=Dillenia turbinata TaxID=194707 RepID=A0AAN8VES7_9MAGN